MRKPALAATLILALFSSEAAAAYMVLLKDGTRYRAKGPYTVTNGKAVVTLESGAVVQVDLLLIDVPRTKQVNETGLGDARVLAIAGEPPAAPKQRTSNLGTVTKLRKTPAQVAQQPRVSAPAATPAQSGEGNLGGDVIARFTAAYENVGVFDAQVTSNAHNTLRAEMTTDTEDQVFKALSATAYMMIRVPPVTKSQIDVVELFLKTIRGGSAGRFRMTRADAEAIDSKRITREQYFVQKVLF